MYLKLVLFFLFNILVVECSRILFIPAHGAASHTKSMYPAAEALKRAGHDVFMLQLVDDPVFASQSKSGVIDYIVQQTQEKMNPDEFYEIVAMLCWKEPILPSLTMIIPWKTTTEICIRALAQNSTRDQVYKILDGHWDVVIVDHLFSMCGVMASQRLASKGVLVIDFSTTILMPESLEIHGAPWSSSTAVHFAIPSYDYKDFLYRFSVTSALLQHISIRRLLDYLVPYWGWNVGLRGVTMTALAEESSLAVTSVPAGLDATHPQAFAVMDLDPGCPPAPSSGPPEPFRQFIEDPASKGTILFAMGHYANWKYAPDGAVDAFVSAFTKLDRYRIIWQFDESKAPKPKVPSNVMLASWIPQMALLHHQKTKLFISHMGLKSMREGICARKPLLAMPMFAEQYRNTAIAKYRGFAVFLDKLNLTTESIYSSIRRILDNESYSNAVGRLQDELNDRIRNATDLFTFKMEFLMRWNKKGIKNKYMKPIWTAPWGLTDLIVPCMGILFAGIGFVF